MNDTSDLDQVGLEGKAPRVGSRLIEEDPRDGVSLASKHAR